MAYRYRACLARVKQCSGEAARGTRREPDPGKAAERGAAVLAGVEAEADLANPGAAVAFDAEAREGPDPAGWVGVADHRLGLPDRSLFH